MTLEQFVSEWNGKYIDFDGHYGFQCVDLIRQYVKEMYKVDPYKAIPAAINAKTIFNNFKDNQYFHKIKNSPYGLPEKGDIIFWGYYPFVTGWDGHVAIYSGGDLHNIVSFDQNYGKPNFCRYVNHNDRYHGVMGWLHWIGK